MARDR